MSWSETAAATVATELYDATLAPGATTPALGADTFASLSLWAQFTTGGVTTRGACRITWLDPNSAAALSVAGPFVSADASTMPEASLYAVPVRAPALTITNTGSAPAKLTVSGSNRPVTAFGVVGPENGVSDLLSGSVAARSTQYPLTAGSGGQSSTRFNGAVTATFTAAGGLQSPAFTGNYIDAQGVAQTLGPFAAGPTTFTHPSCPVRWTVSDVGNSTYPGACSMRLAKS